MNLWIRSQDKVQLLNAVGFYYDYQQEKHHITCLTKEHDYYWIGVYKSKKRALEVLDDINNIKYYKYMASLDIKIFATIIEKKYSPQEQQLLFKQMNTYEMPKE